MHVNRYAAGIVAALALMMGTTACDDLTGLRVDPLLATDTVFVAAPLAENAGIPSALDVVSRNGLIGGGRFPERPAQAGEWDFVVRVRDGEVVLIPAGALGIEYQPLITRALAGETFEGLTRAPERAAFLADSAVVMREGSVYAARSRPAAGAFGSCIQYAKLQPLAVSAAAGTLRMQVTTNERCGDNRLVQ